MNLRWWPALTILVLSAAALGWIWFAGEHIGQKRVMRSFTVLGATVLLLLVWLSFFSRVPWRFRWRWILLCILTLLSIPVL
ncbi:MAG: hypothetical protein ACRD1T_00530, partial [Acidimicrobiia bacterium]